MSQGDADGPDRVLDVRKIDGPPFEEIMAALDELGTRETLLLKSSFEPEPLYDVIGQRGFAYETTQRQPDLWHVRIERD